MGRYKKIIAAMLALVLMVSGCGSAKGVSDDELVSTDAFTGEYLVTADYVVEHMKDDNVLLVDCRGADKAAKGTIEGAIATTWQELCTCDDSYGSQGDEGWGKIPEADDLAKRLAALGMTKDKEIILLGQTLSGWGDDGRVLWELVAAGYTDVKMVDGGIDAVEEAGAATQKGASDPVAGEVTIDSIDNTHVITTDELMDNYDDYKVVDVRTEEEYKGATKYNEAQGGHLPGAIFIPYTSLFREDGTLISQADIEAVLEEAGISKDDKIVTYCTGGIRSAYAQLVFEMAGYENTFNYDQSFWRWAVVGDVE
jgi:thiosulfate/3-mercaptopyruvate sulfurtransferase